MLVSGHEAIKVNSHIATAGSTVLFSPEACPTDTTTATVSQETSRWEVVNTPLIDQGPLFISCAALDAKSRQLVAVTSLEKNRFCELVRFDICSKRWSGCTRTRHFRPPKRIGAAALVARGQLFVTGGYELSNQLISCKVFNGRGRSAGQIIKGSTDSLANSPSAHAAVTGGLPDTAYHVEYELSAETVKEERGSGCDSRGIAPFRRLAQLFGYPYWWLPDPDPPTAETDSNNQLQSILGTLGDFHSYDASRGEWSVIISRDNKVVESSSGLHSELSWRQNAYMQKRYSADQKQLPELFCNRKNSQKRNSCLVPTAADQVPCARAFHTLAKHGDALFLFGGERVNPLKESFSIEYLDDVWMYDMKNMQWSLMYESCAASSPQTTDDVIQCGEGKNISDTYEACSRLGRRRATTSTVASVNEHVSAALEQPVDEPTLDQVRPADEALSIIQKQRMSCSHVAAWEVSQRHPHERLTAAVTHFPLPRSGHSAVCFRRAMYIFGGQNSTLGINFDETWQFDLTLRTWKKLITRGSGPGARFGTMCIYGGLSPEDAMARRAFEEANEDPFAVSGSFVFADYNTMWLLDLQTLIWRELKLTGNPPVAARYFGRLHGFYWDGYLWFGGSTGRSDMTHAFEMVRVEVSDLVPYTSVPSNGSGCSFQDRVSTTSSGSASFRKQSAEIFVREGSFSLESQTRVSSNATVRRLTRYNKRGSLPEAFSTSTGTFATPWKMVDRIGMNKTKARENETTIEKAFLVDAEKQDDEDWNGVRFNNRRASLNASYRKYFPAAEQQPRRRSALLMSIDKKQLRFPNACFPVSQDPSKATLRRSRYAIHSKPSLMTSQNQSCCYNYDFSINEAHSYPYMHPEKPLQDSKSLSLKTFTDHPQHVSLPHNRPEESTHGERLPSSYCSNGVILKTADYDYSFTQPNQWDCSWDVGSPGLCSTENTMITATTTNCSAWASDDSPSFMSGWPSTAPYSGALSSGAETKGRDDETFLSSHGTAEVACGGYSASYQNDDPHNVLRLRQDSTTAQALYDRRFLQPDMAGAATPDDEESLLCFDAKKQSELTALLQAEARRHQEENSILKDAILLLIPYLKTDSLASALNAVQESQERETSGFLTSNDDNMGNAKAGPAGNAIVDLLLKCREHTV